MKNQRGSGSSPGSCARFVFILALVVLGIGAAGRSSEAFAQVQGSQPITRQPSGPHALEIAIAEEAPGFGGFFVDPATRQAYVWSAIEENDEAVRDALRRHWSRGANAVILRGDYDYRDLLAWMLAVGNRGGWNLASIMSAGISQSRNRISFQVFDAEGRDRLVALIEEIEIPLDAVEISFNTEPSIFGFIAAKRGDTGTGAGDRRPAILVKAEETEECGIFVAISDRSLIEARTATDTWSSTGGVEDLVVGAEVWVWVDSVILTSCPGQAHGRRIQIR